MRNIAVIPPLVRQHAEDAAFLFTQRRREVWLQNFGDTDLGRRDQRLAANIAGLVAAGKTGWDIALEQAMEYPGAGEFFALAALALETGENLDAAAELALASRDGRKGISGAIGWSTAERLKPHVKRWLASATAGQRYLGLAALSHHRIDPGDRLLAYLGDPEPVNRSLAVRLAVELGRSDAAPAIADLIADPDTALWSAMALARFRRVVEPLDRVASDPGHPKSGLALDLRLLARPDEAREFLAGLLKNPQTTVHALSRTGVAGDPSILPWLIRQMENAELAVAAGFAFRDLFAIDINDTGLFTDNPDSFGGEFVGRDPAPYPIAVRIEAWIGTGAKLPMSFIGLRRQLVGALRDGINSPETPLANWRRRRDFPAWI
ncbi:MAG: hypothetical protein HC844_17080 [Tabrizicola sp.]|nr:hypothetical protein [Tabrizicola sp.]